MVKRTKFLFAAILPMFAVCANAQVTTSAISGQVLDDEGQPVVGATVQAVHVPSGTKYGAVTNLDGRYTIQGMRTGGPYKVTFSYVGFNKKEFDGIQLSLGNTFALNAKMSSHSQELNEVVVMGSASKFSNEKTGASLNITTDQMVSLPTINRSISDIARLSPYANGMSFAGGDGRSTNFTVDGANFNNNFGLSEALPGGGNPISLDAIDEMQVVIAPYDVRQSNFIGGGVNAITKSGTNTLKGSAYTYQYNQNMHGYRVNGKDLVRPKESEHTFGFTLGGPIIKNKLFFFANAEYSRIPGTVISWRASDENNAPDPNNNISEAKASDLQKVSDYLKNTYGYNTGSYTNFPADEDNLKLLGRIDWNINNNHKLSVRYNYTKNTYWSAPNATSMDGGTRLKDSRVGQYGMSYANSMYSMNNKVNSLSMDLNSRFTNAISNQLLFTYSYIQDIRGTNSSPFPFIDILTTDAQGTQRPYISAGYELFTYNNGVNNKIFNVTDNFTYYAGAHKITAGLNFEHQYANNAYLRNGTGYYRYNSLDDFLSGKAPNIFALTYGFNGNKNPNAQVTFNQIGFYAQDEWNISQAFKLTYGIRLDELIFDNGDLSANNAISSLDFGGRHLDVSKWPDPHMQVSPRVGFTYDVFKDGTLRFRGGTGLFAGRLPLVFFTNMPSNAGMVQNNYSTSDPAILNKMIQNGKLVTNTNDMIKVAGLPTTKTADEGTAPSTIGGVDKHFKMPQVWKTSLAVDYKLPTPFPMSVTGEFMYTKNINAVYIDNWNIKPSDDWERFKGADNRLIYPTHKEGTKTIKDYVYNQKNDAYVLSNTHKGYGWTGNITLNAQPVKNLALMLAYTHTEFKEVSGLPGNAPSSTWLGMFTVNGSNFAGVQRSDNVIPDKVIGSLSYSLPFLAGKNGGNTLHLSVYYTGYSPYGNNYYYNGDMNGDGNANDLMYIPKNDSEIKFKDDKDRAPFWAFVNQDPYLKNHKGEYAESYAARAPWVHRFDARIAQDFWIASGKTKHMLTISLDFMNIGNMFNSKWGVNKSNSTTTNGGRLLKYEGREADNTPIFSLYRDKEGNAPTKSYDYYYDYSQSWKMQVGVRYTF